jgi:hypothetical protein
MRCGGKEPFRWTPRDWMRFGDKDFKNFPAVKFNSTNSSLRNVAFFWGIYFGFGQIWTQTFFLLLKFS